MNERERIIHLWFDMWLKQQDLGIDSIFTEDVIYTESWSPKYESRKTVNIGLMNGILVEKSQCGILNNFFIRKIKLLQNGISKTK